MLFGGVRRRKTELLLLQNFITATRSSRRRDRLVELERRARRREVRDAGTSRAVLDAPALQALGDDVLRQRLESSVRVPYQRFVVHCKEVVEIVHRVSFK